MPFADLREFVERLRKTERLIGIDGAACDLEIGGITEIAVSSDDRPALLFDSIPGYPNGYRVLTNMVNHPRRAALALDLPLDATPLDLVRIWKERIKHVKPVPPRNVSWGPVLENVMVGEQVNCCAFPAPKWHEHDGGRYLGTGSLVIQRDPESDTWVNVGTYRVQVHDRDTLGVFILRSHHGWTIAQKYWSRGKPCPIAMTFGQEPGLWIAATQAVPAGMSEYEYAGGLRGEPVEVVNGDFTGLPIPATAEIAVEGEFLPPDEQSHVEGPFGEWQGYYASGARVEPVVRVKSIAYRNDPIIVGVPPVKPQARHDPYVAIDVGSAKIWDYLEAAGVPDVKGVFRFIAGQTTGYFTVVSIKQRYPGHSRQAAHAVLGCYGGAKDGRFVVVVDDDIDPSNIHEVLWAMATRCDPATSIDLVRGCVGSYLDPRMDPAEKEKGNFTNSRLIIDACRPFHWLDRFPPVNAISPELKAQLLEKWGHILSRS